MESLLARSPSQPRGWLTEQERSALALAAEQAPESDFVTNEEGDQLRAVFKALLARSSPPEVVLPGEPLAFRYGDDAIANRDGQWREALATAGVRAKEVQQ
jgi:hypothetical protein